MTPTFEQALEIVKNLPPAELQKLGDWIRQHQNSAQNEAKRKKVDEQVRKFRLAMKWIDEHRAEFIGQWVCLDGDKLISHGREAKRAFREAEEAGYPSPFCELITEKEENGDYMIGGFEAQR